MFVVLACVSKLPLFGTRAYFCSFRHVCLSVKRSSFLVCALRRSSFLVCVVSIVVFWKKPIDLEGFAIEKAGIAKTFLDATHSPLIPYLGILSLSSESDIF